MTTCQVTDVRPSNVWFLLVDPDTGNAYKGKPFLSVCLNTLSTVKEFKVAVKSKYCKTLSCVDYDELLVLKTRAAYNAEEEQVLNIIHLKHRSKRCQNV